ncbi:MAG TPA: chemotaxis protein CheB [Roseovarius sp.]
MTRKKTPASKPKTVKKGGKTAGAAPEAKQFPVVALGASAGGLEAFTAFLNALPPDTGMAYVLVHHVDPQHKSLMADLLARHTKMPVVLAEDDMPVVPDHVYVIPPNRYIEIEKGVLHLSEPEGGPGTRLPINRFLMSLAADQGRNAVAVILSGTGTDGSAAIAEIKAQGGIVLVQDPAEAQQDGMPRSAIATGAADRVVPIAQMAGIIADFAKHAFVVSNAKKVPFGENARQSLAGIISTLRAHSPINLELYKEGTLLRRIERRMVLRHMQDPLDYQALLMDSPEEAENLSRDLLISVTGFFRDPDAYAWLEDSVLSDLVGARQAGQAVRVWVPGCATGEEAYSLAMLLIERVSTLRQDIRIQIFASDVDEDALATARAGLYPDSIVADVSQKRLDRFFVKEDHSYRVTRELRDAVVFARHDVLADPPFSKLDMISCRNLLIYLKTEAQNRLMEVFHFALSDSGVLFLGMSETVGDGETLFQPLSRKYHIFKRCNTSRARHMPLPVGPGHQQRMSASPHIMSSLPGGSRLAEFSQRALVEHYAPAAVLVDANAETLYLQGRMDPYIRVATGEVSRDLLAMARDGLRTGLASALRNARETDAEAKSTARMMRHGSSVTVDIQVHPLVLDGARLFLVTFQDQAELSPEMAGPPQEGAATHLLEQELEKTRGDLINTIREYERTTEELKASNEEAMSMNEEFQSTNEELETSKEELQSLNEELTTLNTQLQQKIEVERQLSDDLNNFLASSGIATLFLNRDGEIMRFTPTTRELFNLISKDVGRPITDFTSKLDDPTLFDDIAKVQATLLSLNVEVQAQDGKWYNRRILPYRTQDEKIDGVVITFSEISELKELERKTHSAQRFAENIVNTVRDPLLALDRDLNLVWANRSFHRLFDTANGTTVGKGFFTLAGGQWDTPELRRHLGRILPDNIPLDAFSLTTEVPVKGKRDLVLNARKLANDNAGTDLILVALEDMTDQMQAQRSLRNREARLHAILNAVPEGVITIDVNGMITSYSPPSMDVLGYTQSEVMGRNVNMLMPEPHRHRHDGYISAYLSTGEARIIGTGRDLEARHKTGKAVPIHLKLSEVTIGDEKQFLGVIRDLTEERESRKQLEQAQKMEAIGQLAGGIAHDFNNLLTVLIGNIELLEMRPDDPNRDDILSEALEAANLGAALVAKLLLLSKRRRLAPERLELPRVIEELKPILRRTLGGQIVIAENVDEDVDLVLADPGQIESAVLNLAINARDAMPQGGTLTIRAQNTRVEAGQRTDDHADLAPGDYVVLSVRDTGSGMTPEVMSRAFEPFFTTKANGDGTGLGLPMMYGWARQSGGAVTLRSKPGEGTEVRLYLPAVEAGHDAPQNGAMAADGTVEKSKGETVLLVEDDPRVRNLTRQRLEYLGYQVVEAEDGPAALAQLETGRDIRLMLSDIVMPGGIDGFELASKASALCPDLQIVLTTGFAPKSGDTTWPMLRKPYGMDTLAKALRKLLDDRG